MNTISSKSLRHLTMTSLIQHSMLVAIGVLVTLLVAVAAGAINHNLDVSTGRNMTVEAEGAAIPGDCGNQVRADISLGGDGHWT